MPETMEHCYIAIHHYYIAYIVKQYMREAMYAGSPVCFCPPPPAPSLHAMLPATTGGTTGLRQALLIGFANRLARRMTTHNGYKTLSEPSTLAQLHPSTARIVADEDGLLPEWVIYHELISTAKVFLSRVSCCHRGLIAK